MGMSNKIFCTAPFTTLRIESYNNSSTDHKDLGVVFKPGCVYDPMTPISSLDEYLDGSEMSAHRDNLCNGTVPRLNCHRCSTPEKLGLQSIRLDLLKKPWASDQKKIYLLDIFYGNTCNLGCLMCGPEWSSYAAEERYKAGLLKERVKSKNNIPVALRTMKKLPDLKSVSFIGGEFFIVKENVLILDQIIEMNLGCSISTNASLLDDKMIAKLEQIKDLEVQISVDGTEDVYELIRFPASWEVFTKNVQELKKRLSWAKIHFNIVIQPLNIQNLHEVYECNNKFLCHTHHQIIDTPFHLSWPILLLEERNRVSTLLKEKQQQKYAITKQQKQTIDDLIQALDRVEHSPELRAKAVTWLSTLLKYRKVSNHKIKKVTGVFDTLGNELIDRMNQTA